MSNDLSQYRLATGTVTTATLEADSASVVKNWAVQTDMQNAHRWAMYMPETLSVGVLTRGLDGIYRARGGYSGVMEFLMLTSDMVAYLDTNIFGDTDTARVSIRTHYQGDFIVLNTILDKANAIADANMINHEVWANVRFPFHGGVLAA